MNDNEMNELARILTDEKELQPMTGFSTRVMRAVKEEATGTKPIAFPWTRFLPGLLLNLGLLLGIGVWILLEFGRSSGVPFLPAGWWSDPQAQGLLWATLTVIGSMALTWATLRWVAPRQTTSF